jgi:adenine-specific DNA-methyltransferase
MSNQKLELIWIGKDQQPRLEPRILIEDPSKSFGDKNSENMLIFGDNLLALKALEQDFAGKVKCIYIDPPYNTGSAFEHYDDNLEHSTWLSLMVPRLRILRNLLSEDGSIWIQIDDEEQAYLKVLCDEIFGRKNFVNMISVNMKNTAGASGGGEDKRLKKNCEYILIYAKRYDSLPLFNAAFEYTEMYEVVEQYRKDGVNWHYTSVLVYEGEKEYVNSTIDGDGNEIKIYIRRNPIIKSIKQVMKDDGITEKEAYYKYSNKIFEAKDAQTSIRTRIIQARKNFSITEDLLSIEYVPRSGRNKGKLYEQFYKGDKCRLFAWLRDIGEMIDGILYKKDLQGTYWNFTSSINNLTKEGGVVFPNGKKPEQLLKRILEMTSTPGDIVLDSFLGSGTTAAVAHKMGRKWIGIELGEHCHSHCLPRIKKVITGGDQGGISQSINWKGGGGFKYYYLAPSLLNQDSHGNWVISKEYNPEMLAAAMAKHEDFYYAPDREIYWKQGYSTEKDFIFTTTTFMTIEFLDKIHEEMLPDESLLICCKAFQDICKDRYPNITIKKIPNMLLGRCEFGKEDYSINIVNIPIDNDELEEDEETETEDPSDLILQEGLFAEEDDEG